MHQDNKLSMNNLSKINPGVGYFITGYKKPKRTVDLKNLLVLGFTRGTKIVVNKLSPGGKYVEVTIRGEQLVLCHDTFDVLDMQISKCVA